MATLNVLEIGIRIRKMREQKLIKREDFAESISTSIENLKRIENGNGLPSIELLVKISEKLNTSIESILLRDDNKIELPSNMSVLISKLSPQGKKLLANIANEIHKYETMSNTEE
ncbi:MULTISPECIES: helix-turn-helix domain-containing protein [Bacillus amyloliquefaciens group]|uniref:helix-turn-helix domain-containing protein n=1 Tax=Bacillus amyloliquefaciens group TaxID=1938374 RepID=UPI0013F64245|nr:helix-turn-helix transcriptional regulator [Bacillus velezensis]MEC2215925.1 helix-turn-helix transcriptional regulator [Bacillus velezensis]